ncbi:hypothetical protein AVEN_162775-1 [Araneus ventricosus]|uniref:Uncharacterized protein n=1 Tax=Araneus ventricosus TaxID=182803 RepID=A0A4Y2TY53_ARAVE|nr:hypothetical protein AVEN_162775-1 [Araneus ventricosus]
MVTRSVTENTNETAVWGTVTIVRDRKERSSFLAPKWASMAPSIDRSKLEADLHCKSASLTEQECKCETSLQQVNANLEVTMRRTCSKLALQTHCKLQQKQSTNTTRDRTRDLPVPKQTRLSFDQLNVARER